MLLRLIAADCRTFLMSAGSQAQRNDPYFREAERRCLGLE
jgi:hypothetical protein